MGARVFSAERRLSGTVCGLPGMRSRGRWRNVCFSVPQVPGELPAEPRPAERGETAQATLGAEERLPPSATRGTGPTRDPRAAVFTHGR